MTIHTVMNVIQKSLPANQMRQQRQNHQQHQFQQQLQRVLPHHAHHAAKEITFTIHHLGKQLDITWRLL